MVLIVSKEGQLANRLAHASAFIANSLANNYRLVHFFFEDYYPFFSEQLNQHRSLLKVFLIKDTGINKIVRSSISLFIRGMLKLRITKLPFLEIIDTENMNREHLFTTFMMKSSSEKQNLKLYWFMDGFSGIVKIKKPLGNNL